MKKLFFILLSLLSLTSFTHAANQLSNDSHSINNALFSNCPQAKPLTDPAFCASFKSVAYCHCTEHGMAPAACNDMKRIYDAMMLMYHTLEKACSRQVQQDTDPQTCINDWNYYHSHC